MIDLNEALWALDMGHLCNSTISNGRALDDQQVRRHGALCYFPMTQTLKQYLLNNDFIVIYSQRGAEPDKRIRFLENGKDLDERK